MAWIDNNNKNDDDDNLEVLGTEVLLGAFVFKGQSEFWVTDVLCIVDADDENSKNILDKNYYNAMLMMIAVRAKEDAIVNQISRSWVAFALFPERPSLSVL